MASPTGSKVRQRALRRPAERAGGPLELCGNVQRRGMVAAGRFGGPEQNPAYRPTHSPMFENGHFSRELSPALLS